MPVEQITFPGGVADSVKPTNVRISTRTRTDFFLWQLVGNKSSLILVETVPV